MTYHTNKKKIQKEQQKERGRRVGDHFCANKLEG